MITLALTNTLPQPRYRSLLMQAHLIGLFLYLHPGYFFLFQLVCEIPGKHKAAKIKQTKQNSSV